MTAPSHVFGWFMDKSVIQGTPYRVPPQLYGNWFPARKLMYYAYEKCYAIKMRNLLKNCIKMNEAEAESNTVNL